MSDAAIVRAAIYLLRASGSRPSIRKVEALIRVADRQGRGMRTARVMELMEAIRVADLNSAPGNDLTRDGQRFNAPDLRQHSGNVLDSAPGNDLTRDGQRFNDDVRQQSGNTVVENTKNRDTVVESANAASTPPSDADAEALTPPSQPPAQLGLIPESPSPAKPAKTRVPNRAEEILSLVWTVAGDSVSRSMTEREWRMKQRRVAKDLASVGRSDEDILEAHASASRRFSGPCYSLSIVQSELMRLDSNREPEPELEVLDDYVDELIAERSRRESESAL